MADYQYILVERRDALAIVTLNRPKHLNALHLGLMSELADALEELDQDADIRAIVLTGAGDRAFAAGADIKEMADKSPFEMKNSAFISAWTRTSRIMTPIIAAVNGYALGGGFELALQCDIIVASENARFGQPEILIGIIPGAGGTQRLARVLGKYKTMELILLGETLKAQELADLGLVNKIVPVGEHLKEAITIAKKITARPPLAVKAAKHAVLAAFETSLTQGMEIERQNFFMLFSTEDQKEGMQAFINKREAKFEGR